MKDWQKRLVDEFENFRNETLNLPKEKIFNKYEEINLYFSVYEYLIKADKDTYKDLTLKEIYSFYISDEDEYIAFTSNKDIECLLDRTLIEHKRDTFFNKYLKEYYDFENKILKESKEHLYCKSEKIRFYKQIYSYIMNEKYDVVKTYMKDRTIRDLYLQFRNNEYCNDISSLDKIQEFLQWAE